MGTPAYIYYFTFSGGQKSKYGVAGSVQDLMMAEIKMLAGDVVLSWDAGSSKLIGPWQNSFASCCRIKVPNFLLLLFSDNLSNWRLSAVPWPMALTVENMKVCFLLDTLEHVSLISSSVTI